MNTTSNHSHIFMIGGPNGAGKTTSAFSLLPELVNCYEYVNADSIAASLSPFNPQTVSIQAGRLMLLRLDELAKEKVNFAFETTMSSRTFVNFLKQAKSNCYQISLLYLWLASPDLAICRVKERVNSGGHFIPDKDVERRYYRSMSNFINLYMPLADRWGLYDNSSEEPLIIAKGNSQNEKISIYNNAIWNQFSEVINEK